MWLKNIKFEIRRRWNWLRSRNLNKETIILRVAAYNREWPHSPSSNQQMEQMRADLNENMIRYEEKLKNLENKFEYVKDEYDLELVPRKLL